MRKIFLILILALLSKISFAQQYDNWTSSSAFQVVNIASAATSIVPSTTTRYMIQNVIELLFKNMSSSMTVFFSSSDATAFTLSDGFAISPLETLAIPWNPRVTYSTETSTRLHFMREGGGVNADGLNIPIRVWIRYKE